MNLTNKKRDEEKEKKDSQENLKKEREFERKKRAITNFIYGFNSTGDIYDKDFKWFD